MSDLETPMTPEPPHCCSPAAFKSLARQLPTIERASSLVAAAVAISAHRSNVADIRDVERKLDQYADRIRSRVKGTQPQALLAHLHAVLFDEEGFTGNRDRYDLDANSYLPSVLITKTGLPITLALVYKAVADRLGLRCWGVGLPGHFLAGIEIDGQTMLVDCFNGGRILTAEEARDRIERQFEGEVGWTEEFLQPLTHRSWITRMLQNLLNLFGKSDRFTEVAAMLELEMILWPQEERLQRDLGLVLARCGMNRPAGVWLDRYLDTHPDDPQYPELSQLRSVLG
jgi:regulator of sirC expression with transglutaminase-like and TPR domain